MFDGQIKRDFKEACNLIGLGPVGSDIEGSANILAALIIKQGLDKVAESNDRIAEKIKYPLA